MIKLLISIVNVIGALITFVINTIISLVTLLLNIPTYLTFIVSSINLLPTAIIPFAVATVTISVVLFIIGRNK